MQPRLPEAARLRLAPLLRGPEETLGLACLSEDWYQAARGPAFWRNCIIPELDFRLAAHRRLFQTLSSAWRAARVACQHVWLLADSRGRELPFLQSLQGLVITHLSLVDEDNDRACAVTGATLQELPALFPQLRRLELPRLAPDVRDEAWLDCLAQLKDLVSLDFVGFTDDRLAALVAQKQGFQRLGFRFSDITSDGLQQSLRDVAGLLELQLSNCDQLEHEDWLEGASEGWGRELRVLELAAWEGEGIAEGSLDHIARLSTLEELNLGGCINNAGLRRLGELVQSGSFRQLKKLDISHVGEEETQLDQLAFLQDLHDLRELRLPEDEDTVTGACLQYVAPLTNLQVLTADMCVADDDLRHLARLVGLRTLELSRQAATKITDTGLAALANLHGLEKLALCKARGITGTGLADLSRMKELRHLDLSGCGLTDEGLLAVQEPLSSLRLLELTDCSGLTDTGLTSLLRTHHSLRVLHLHGCTRITGTGLASLPALADLDLSECTGLTDQGLGGLGKLRGLRRLKLGSRTEQARFTVDGLRALWGGLSCLEELHLYNGRSPGPVDNGALQGLEHCARLERLVVHARAVGSVLLAGDLANLRELEIEGLEATPSPAQLQWLLEPSQKRLRVLRLLAQVPRLHAGVERPAGNLLTPESLDLVLQKCPELRRSVISRSLVQPSAQVAQDD